MITILTSYNFEIRSNCPNSLGLEYLPQVQYSLLPAVIPYGTIYKRNKYIVEHATRQVDNINSAREEVKKLSEEGVDCIKAIYSDKTLWI